MADRRARRSDDSSDDEAGGDDGGLDCIVVGAGFSGLAAARLLVDRGARVRVLEARNRVGGRAHTVPVDLETTGATTITDVGCAYVGPAQTRILALADEVGADTFCVHTAGTSLMLANGKRYEYQGVVPTSMGIVPLLDLNHALRQIDAMAATVPLAAPWDAARAAEWDAVTVENFVRGATWTELARNVIRGAVRTITFDETSCLSFLWFLWYVHSSGGVKQLTEMENGAQERKFLHGAAAVYNAMHARLPEDTVELGRVVTDVVQADNRVEVTCRDGSKHAARFIVLAMPPNLIGRLTFAPQLPSHRLQLHDRMPLGACIKAIMFYERPFWRDAGYNGVCLSDEGPASWFCDDCKPGAKHPALIAFVVGDFARRWCEFSREKRLRALCVQFAMAFGEEALAPLGFVEKNWMTEEYSAGGPVGFTAPGTLTKYGFTIREPIGRIHFAGTETATVFAGYMDGAVSAGEREAGLVLARLSGEGVNVDALQLPREARDTGPGWIPPLPAEERFAPSPTALLLALVVGLVAVVVYLLLWR